MPTPDDLLATAPLDAAVAALAERNHHHLEQMSPAEREDAIAHWRQLAVTVLTAAGAALGDGGAEEAGAMLLALEDGFRLHRLIDPASTPPDAFARAVRGRVPSSAMSSTILQ